MNGADQVPFGIEKLNDPGDAGNRGLGHHDLPAIRFDGARRDIDIVHNDRAFKVADRLRRRIESTRLDRAEGREGLARGVLNLAEVSARPPIALKCPAEDAAIEFAGAFEVVSVNREMRELIGHGVPS